MLRKKEQEEQVRCQDLVRNIKDEKVRQWLLEKIQPKGKYKISNGCMYLSDANLGRDKNTYAMDCCQKMLKAIQAWESEHSELLSKNSDEYNKQREAKRQQLQQKCFSEIQQFMQSNEDDVNNLFSIVDVDYLCQQEYKDRLLKIKKGMYDDKILGGVYNVFMPDGNTYFHSLIASDLTHYALELFEHINSTVNSSNNKHKNNIEDLIPFTKFDSGKFGPKKNFLMLAIAKKYDNEDFHAHYIPKALPDYEEYNQVFRQLMPKEQIAEKYDKQILYPDMHKLRFQNNDAKLIAWLIKNAPRDCLKQVDQEGYNLVDYAIMKMDKDVLSQLAKRDDNLFKVLLKQSRLFSDLSENKLNYNDAKEIVKKRYNCPAGIAIKVGWQKKRKEVIEFLNNYIKKAGDKDLNKIVVPEYENIGNDKKEIHQSIGSIVDFTHIKNHKTRFISDKKKSEPKNICDVHLGNDDTTFRVIS